MPAGCAAVHYCPFLLLRPRRIVASLLLAYFSCLVVLCSSSSFKALLAKQAGKSIMLLRDPIERAFSIFLEECSKGHVGWSCMSERGNCSVTECEYSGSQHRRSTCSHQSQIPAELKKAGGVCSVTGFEDFLFDKSFTTPRAKDSSKIRQKILKPQSLYEDLLSFQRTQQNNQLHLTSMELLRDPKTAKKEVETIEDFLGREILSNFGSISEKVATIESLFRQKTKSSILTVSTSAPLESVTITVVAVTQDHKRINLRGAQQPGIRQPARTNRRRVAATKTESLLSPAVLSYLKGKLCPNFQRLESLLINEGLIDSHKRLAALLGQNSCSTGSWWSDSY